MIALLVLLTPLCSDAQDRVAAYRSDRILVKPARGTLEELHGRHGTRTHKRYPRFENLEVIQLPPTLSVEEALRAFRESGLVEYAEPDYLVEAGSTSPNDPAFISGYSWGLHNPLPWLISFRSSVVPLSGRVATDQICSFRW